MSPTAQQVPDGMGTMVMGTARRGECRGSMATCLRAGVDRVAASRPARPKEPEPEWWQSSVARRVATFASSCRRGPEPAPMALVAEAWYSAPVHRRGPQSKSRMEAEPV